MRFQNELIRKTLLIFSFLIVHSYFLKAQLGGRLSLEDAQLKAVTNYPLSKNRGLIKERLNLISENLSMGYFPQLSLSGQASYQSDVTHLDLSVPGIKINTPTKDQFRLLTEVTQLIYDAGAIRLEKSIQAQSAEIDEQNLEVDLFALRQRINQTYLMMLLLQEQVRVLELVKADIELRVNTMAAQVENKVVLQSNLLVLKSERLKLDQQMIELNASRQSLIDVLSILVNEKIANDVTLVRPASQKLNDEIHRPEVGLFSRQSAQQDLQKKLLRSKTIPKLHFFGQVGVGKPGLNLLSNDVAFFYIGGVRLTWNLSSLYTVKNEKRLLDISKNLTQLQKETFLLNTNAELAQQRSQVRKFEQLIETDKEIIRLRESIVTTAKVQLDNKVITAGDYVRELNAEAQARQALILHELQLLQSNINYQTLSGN